MTNITLTPEQQTKTKIETAIKAFKAGNLVDNAHNLLTLLGYKGDSGYHIDPPVSQEFLALFETASRNFNADKALLDKWLLIDIISQFSGSASNSNQLQFNFGAINPQSGNYDHFLFFAIELPIAEYSRTKLANATREINKLFPTPVSVIFKYGQSLTISIVTHRPNRKDTYKDVLEKVTLIKDIDINSPHRAHLEILYDLSLPQLHSRFQFNNFDGLQKAWQQTLDSSELNKRFFREIADWYFWAEDKVEFPVDAGPTAEMRNATGLIRLLTRLIFVWFLKEKNLIPEALFNESEVQKLLKDLSPDKTTYYKAILQNLFFATLNQEMNTPDKSDNRRFRRAGQNYNITNLYRYEDYFQEPDKALSNFEEIPFLNGGLFECLDKPDKDANNNQPLRIDGFSDRPDNVLKIPNELFFGAERTVDLIKAYGKSTQRQVRGLINILQSYKFTITENTPIEEEIALDPELLGKVFENLLAYYNPETQTTARKQTGSFYTPREIVNYMVDESLMAYFKEKLEGAPDLEIRLRHLFALNDEPHQFEPPEVSKLIKAIDQVKVLDPACGSGAFPMGILHRLVTLLQSLDPNNTEWKQRQLDNIDLEFSHLLETADKMKQDVEQAFERNELDYPRKLYLIENCIYGVDIQPIAVQIAKLRCFISLIVDQKIDAARPNLGVRPLPNLETKFVAANSLIGIERPSQTTMDDFLIKDKEEALGKVRASYFNARTPSTKKKYRELDNSLRNEIAGLLQNNGFQATVAQKLARWDPYDQNLAADFFDPEWMFNVTIGFDVIIGNPPYVRQEAIKDQKPSLAKALPEVYAGTADLYVYFYGQGFKLLKPKGWLAYISSNKWFKANYGIALRKYIADNFRVKDIIDFGELPVFEAATFPMIFIAQKKPQGDESVIFTQIKSLEEPYPDINALTTQKGLTLPNNALKGSEWSLTSPNKISRFEKMEAAGIRLEEYVNKQIYYGIKTGYNTAFVIDGAKRAELIAKDPKSAELIKPLALGDDVRKWRVEDKDRWIILTKIGVDITKYPTILEHLKQWQPQLESRYDKGNYWWELRKCAYYRVFNTPKIVYPEIAKESRFTLDASGIYPIKTVFSIPVNDLYLLGVLNTTIVWEYLKNICSVLGDAEKGGRLLLQSIYLSKVPIPKATNEEKKQIEVLVQNCLNLKGVGCEKYELEIDKLVTKLYKL